MRRRDLVMLAGILAASAAPTVRAQPPAKQFRIVIADGAFTAATWRTFPLYRRLLPELGRLGEVEGENLVAEYFTAEGHVERYADLARRVVERNPDVIVCLTGDLVPSLIAATHTIPIVAFMGYEVFGQVKTLARPSGNLTGINVYAGEQFASKRLQLLKEAVPRASRVAVLNTQTQLNSASYRANLQSYAAKFGLSLSEVVLRDPSPPEIERGFAELARNRPDALLIASDPILLAHARLVTQLAERGRLPAIYPYPAYAENGALMTYTYDPADLTRQFADDVHQILHGANPGDIPIYQATRFKLTLNLNAARQIGLTFPSSMMAAADEVIE